MLQRRFFSFCSTVFLAASALGGLWRKVGGESQHPACKTLPSSSFQNTCPQLCLLSLFQSPMLYFVHVIHFQSSLRVKEGSAQWVRILRSAFFLNRLSANSPYLGPDFPATLGYLVLSICETSVGSWNTLGFISAFLTASLESPALNHLQHLSSSLCPCVLMLKMKISSLSFSIAS